MRVCAAAVAARAVEGSRVGLIGGAFEGMGDFRVSYDELRERFGIEVLPQQAERMRAWNEAGDRGGDRGGNGGKPGEICV